MKPRVQRMSVACGIIFLVIYAATAQTEDYVCQTNEGTITITRYIGAGGNVTIPDRIADFPVTAIGSYSFYDCSGVTHVSIPNTVTAIGFNAFYCCPNLVSVTIPESVTDIGDCAFAYCSSLANVSIPPSVTSINNAMFIDCTSLANLELPESLTSIGEFAFYHCVSLATVQIPRNVSAIGRNAFGNCTKLTAFEVDALNPFYSSPDGTLLNRDRSQLIQCPSGRAGGYVIPDTVTDIHDSAFEFCTDLTRVSVPVGLVHLGDSAFFGCNNLTEILFHGDAPVVGAGVFAGAELVTVYFPHDAAGWGATFAGRPTGLWDSHSECIYTITGNGITITKYIGLSGAVMIPSTIDGLSITSIGNSAFHGCATITNVTIPDSITNIEDCAFLRCSGLTSVTIGNGVATIGGWAFSECTSLSHARLPGSVRIIGQSAFSDCWSLTSIEIPDNVITIGYSAFSGCARLASVTIPKSVTSIGSQAFASCASLVAIYVDPLNPAYSSLDGVLFDWNRSTLLQCPESKTGNYIIPNSVAWIGDHAFVGCDGLTDISIPDGVTRIGTGAFESCTGLTGIVIPRNVTAIGAGAFFGCTALTAITIDPLNPCFSSVEGVLLDKTLTRLIQYPQGKCGSYTIPLSVSSIGYNALSGCSGLTSIYADLRSTVFSSLQGVLFDKDQTRLIQCPGGKTGSYIIPDNVTTIAPRAFWGCNALSSVTVSDTVTTIEAAAFVGCSGLVQVYFEGNAPAHYDGWPPPIFEGANYATVYHLPGTLGWTDTYAGRPTAVWALPYPVILTSSPNFGLQTNAVGFRISWATSGCVVVEASETLENPAWSPVSTNALTDGWCDFADVEWTNYPSRFYRVASH